MRKLKVLTLLLMGDRDAVSIHQVHGNILKSIDDVEKSDVVFISGDCGNIEVFPDSCGHRFLCESKRMVTKAHRTLNFFSRCRFEQALGKLISNYDLVITDGLLTSALISKEVTSLAVKCLTVVHGEVLKIKPLVKRRLGYLSSELFFYSCVSGAVETSLNESLDLKNANVEVIFSGLDVKMLADRRLERQASRAIFELSDDDFVVGCLARIEKHKGIKELVVGFRRYLKGNPKAKLLLIGDGNEFDAVRDFCLSEGISGSVLMPGYLENADQYLMALDVFVLLSKAEGLGLSVLEAQLAQLPIILSDIPVFREIQARSDSEFCQVIGSDDELVGSLTLMDKKDKWPVDYDLTWFDVSSMKGAYRKLVSRMMEIEC